MVSMAGHGTNSDENKRCKSVNVSKIMYHRQYISDHVSLTVYIKPCIIHSRYLTMYHIPYMVMVYEILYHRLCIRPGIMYHVSNCKSDHNISQAVY